ERARERVRSQVRSQLRGALAHDRERLGLADEVDPARLHARVLLEEAADRVHLSRRRAIREEDVDDELLLLRVRPGDEPRAEADEDAEEEHPDQHGRRGGERGRLVGADRAQRLRYEQPEPAHSAPYPPRLSSRTSLPSSSAITRLRILSTISRSCVTMRMVVPVRLMR